MDNILTRSKNLAYATGSQAKTFVQKIGLSNLVIFIILVIATPFAVAAVRPEFILNEDAKCNKTVSYWKFSLFTGILWLIYLVFFVFISFFNLEVKFVRK
jgi:hypothetical protein